MIRAFRDTWELGIHSYLTYLRDRLLLAKELLHESGSCFVQISDENVHLVRSIMDEVFGASNFCVLLCYRRLGTMIGAELKSSAHYLVWYAKSKDSYKFRKSFEEQVAGIGTGDHFTQLLDATTGETRPMTAAERRNPGLVPTSCLPFQLVSLQTHGVGSTNKFPIRINREEFLPGKNKAWRTTETGIASLVRAHRLQRAGSTVRFRQFLSDFPYTEVGSIWTNAGRDPESLYVVQTPTNIVERCMLMVTDPGDLVFDPTCGSGTTAYVAEQWGRRWITCDTSRVAVTLAKQRLMSAEFDYYDLAHPEEGVGSGFRYKTVPHVTLKSIANNPEIREGMTREQIDAAIARYADQETLYDQPYTDKSRVRVTGPFTVEAVPAPTVRSLDDIIIANPSSSHVIPNPVPAPSAGTGGEESASPSPVIPNPAAGPAAVGEGSAFSSQGHSQQSIGDFRHAATPLLDASVIPNPAAGSAAVGEGSAVSVPFSPAFPASTAVARKGATLRHAEWRDELLKTGLRGKGGHHIDFARVEPLAGTRWLHADAETKGVKAERVVFSFGPEHSLLDRNQVELAWEEARTLSPRPAMLVFAAFEFDPDAAREIDSLTKDKTGMTFLTAQMNADLLTEDLKKKRASNQGFWLVGRPDVDLRKASKSEIESAHCHSEPRPAFSARAGGEESASRNKRREPMPNGSEFYVAEVRGFDYYNTRTGTIDSGDTSKIAMWLLDTDYDGRSLYPRQVFFPMADDDEGWAKLARNLKAEIDSDLIEKYRGTVSLPFEAGPHKRIAVKVIDDRGIESLKVVNLK
jgi:adenine-specific DNA-methyltransferase